MNKSKRPKTVMLRARCSPDLATRLEQVAQASVARNLADHIRFAVERYVAQEEERSRQAEGVQA